MAESIGIFIEINIDEKDVKRLLNHKFEEAQFGNKLGYYFSELLYNTQREAGNVFIFNYDKKLQKCFIAYLINHFNEKDLSLFPKIFEIMSGLKIPDTIDYGIVASTYPEVLWAYKIMGNKVEKISSEKTPENIVVHLSEKFWSFSTNNDFPEPQKALNERNYFYKNFKNYYTKYLGYIEEIEKPSKIAKATKENPYHLFNEFYTYDLKVYEHKSYTRQIIELPKADPLTLRSVAGIIADKNHAYICRLAAGSPPNVVDHGKYTTNNPNSVWEWIIAEGVHGGSLTYVKEKWNTVYWKDKYAVFHSLKKVEDADVTSFVYLDFCFGKDKNHVFYLDKIIPIDVNNFILNKNGFIYDNENIFHYQHKIPLDAKSFKVLTYESEVNPFMGTFILEDKNGKYEYNILWKDKLIKPLS